MPSPSLYNTCWMLSCLPEAIAFSNAASRVAETQSAVLQKIVSNNSNSTWGKRHGFQSIRSPDDFRRQVPLSQYADYVDSIESIAAGETGIFTSDSVELLEPTSGSTAGEKLIPYNASLRRSFQRAIRVWMWDLLRHRPALRRGTAYWSISPLANVGRTTSGGIRIGFDDDSAYLGSFERWMLANTLSVPPEIALCESVPAAQYVTLFFLLRDPRLALISVWSPTFLVQLLSFLRTNAEPLCRDIAHGSIAGEHFDMIPEGLCRSFGAQSDRAAELHRILEESPADWVNQIWPRLSLVSCWADGPSRIYAENLARMLPGVELQPKGLLATEGVVTIPLLNQPGGALAIRSHFFEFQPIETLDGAGDFGTVLAHELEVGREYRVIITTAGGLYRYQLNDQVQVVGFIAQVPLLRFVGKCDDTLDLVGEKLSAAHVQRAVEHAIHERRLSPTFMQMVVEAGDTPRYVLKIACVDLGPDECEHAELASKIERELCKNLGYRYARELGQLECLRVCRISRDEADQMVAEHNTNSLQGGMRYGNIKPTLIAKPLVGRACEKT